MCSIRRRMTPIAEDIALRGGSPPAAAIGRCGVWPSTPRKVRAACRNHAARGRLIGVNVPAGRNL
jgi:hypothetical protein